MHDHGGPRHPEPNRCVPRGLKPHQQRRGGWEVVSRPPIDCQKPWLICTSTSARRCCCCSRSREEVEQSWHNLPATRPDSHWIAGWARDRGNPRSSVLRDQSWLANSYACAVPLGHGAPNAALSGAFYHPGEIGRIITHANRQAPARAPLPLSVQLCQKTCGFYSAGFQLQQPRKSSVRKYELSGLESCFRQPSRASPCRGLLGENGGGGIPAASRVTRCDFQLTSEQRLLAQIGPTRLLAAGPQETRWTGGWDGPGRSCAITVELVETCVDPLDCISGR